jgi:recombination protein RecA
MAKKRADLKVLVAALNKKLGGESGRALVQLGSEIRWSSAKRFSTGSLGLDIALNGGIPRGMVTQFFGEESSFKTTMALKACALIQKLYGSEARIGWIAVEPFDKHWANQVGVAIPFTKEELRLMRPKDRTRYEKVKNIGEFLVVSAISGEDNLQAADDMIKSGVFHIVVLDSIAALQPMAEVEKEMDEKTMGQLPRLVGQFLKKCYSAFNTELEDGERNETAVVLINQVREKIGGYGHPEPEPPGGRALRHACAATVRFKKSEVYKTDDTEKKAYGRRIKTRVEKSKIGPPLREAEFDFYFEEAKGFGPGDIDGSQELRRWGVAAGLIDQTSNTMYVLDGKKYKGKAALDAFLAANPAKSANLRRDILRVLTSADVE